MKKIISKRVVKYKFINYKFEKYITKYLFRKFRNFNLDRGQPLAIFAHDYIGVKTSIFGNYEKEEIADLLHFTNSIGIKLSEGTTIDIGGNIGIHAIEFSKISKKVLSFEPNPRVYEILKINTKNLNNIEIFNYGCGKKNETLNLQETFKNLGASSAAFKVRYLDNTVKIQIKPLDEIFDNLSSVNLIKIDVEGMEADVVRGAEKVITKFLPVICFEQHEIDFLSKFHETETIDFLRSIGYKIFVIHQKSIKNPILKKINDIKQLIFGIIDEREVIETKKLNKKFYSMIFAVHSSAALKL